MSKGRKKIQLSDLSQSDLQLLWRSAGAQGAGLKLPSGVVIPDQETFERLQSEVTEANGPFTPGR